MEHGARQTIHGCEDTLIHFRIAIHSIPSLAHRLDMFPVVFLFYFLFSFLNLGQCLCGAMQPAHNTSARFPLNRMLLTELIRDMTRSIRFPASLPSHVTFRLSFLLQVPSDELRVYIDFTIDYNAFVLLVVCRFCLAISNQILGKCKADIWNSFGSVTIRSTLSIFFCVPACVAVLLCY